MSKNPFELPSSGDSGRNALSEIDDVRQMLQIQREELDAKIQSVLDLIKREAGSVAKLTKLGTWISFTFKHTDFQTAADNTSITLFTLPGRGVVQACFLAPTTQFAGTGITQYQLSIGYAGALDAYTPLFDVNTAVADSNFQFVPVLDMRALTADTALKVQAQSVGGLLNASTAGVVEIWLLLSRAK